MRIGDKVTLTSDGTLCTVTRVNGTLIGVVEVDTGKCYAIHIAFVRLLEE